MTVAARCAVAALVVVASVRLVAADTPPLGSPQFRPTPDQPVGWRGDGSGRYPGATPPTTWERKRTADGYATKNILWAAPLPNTGVSTPIVVGDRIFVTCEPSDLLCLDKATGRVLWVRSTPEFEAVTAEVRAATPAIAETLDPMLPDLTKANAEVVEALNAELPKAAAAPSRQPGPAVKNKRAVEKKIADGQTKADKKGFTHNWAQAVFGYAGATPTSDGKRVYVFLTTGVTVCYDLDGNRLWVARGGGDGSEHGNFASPVLCDGRLVVWANEMRGYDAETGKLIWSNPAKAFNTYGSLFRVRSGGEWVAGFQWGFFARVKDGQPAWDKGIFGDSVCTPIVEGNTIFAHVGYPRGNSEKVGFKAYKIPPSTNAGKLTPAYAFKMDWADDELPVDKQKNPFDRGFVASPLLVDGLIYQVTQGGGLFVNDAATGDLVYRKVLPIKPKTQYWNWAGCGASPTMAGGYVYLMDNQGTTIVVKPGKTYQEVARNVIEESTADGKEQVQNLASPIFDGGRMYWRTPGRLYCVGER